MNEWADQSVDESTDEWMGVRETPEASHFVCFGFDFEARAHYVSPSSCELTL